MQPHRSRYWLNGNPDDPVAFKQQVNAICQLHLSAQELLTQRVHVISTDEMTGIQALERAQPTQPMQLRQVERIEFEYIRHGTLSLIANWEIAAGQVLTPSIGPTRNSAAKSHCQHD